MDCIVRCINGESAVSNQDRCVGFDSFIIAVRVGGGRIGGHLPVFRAWAKIRIRVTSGGVGVSATGIDGEIAILDCDRSAGVDSVMGAGNEEGSARNEDETLVFCIVFGMNTVCSAGDGKIAAGNADTVFSTEPLFGGFDAVIAAGDHQIIL